MRKGFSEVNNINYEDPFSELIRDPHELDDQSKLSHVLNKSMADFFGKLALSALMQYLMTAAYVASSAKALALDTKDITYKEAFNNFFGMPKVDYQLDKAKRMYVNRAKTVLFTSTLCAATGELFDVPPLAVAVANSALLAGMTSPMRAEARLQFELANKKRYSHLPKAVDISKAISFEKFNEYYSSDNAKTATARWFDRYEKKCNEKSVTATWADFVRN